MRGWIHEDGTDGKSGGLFQSQRHQGESIYRFVCQSGADGGTSGVLSEIALTNVFFFLGFRPRPGSDAGQHQSEEQLVGERRRGCSDLVDPERVLE